MLILYMHYYWHSCESNCLYRASASASLQNATFIYHFRPSVTFWYCV